MDRPVHVVTSLLRISDDRQVDWQSSQQMHLWSDYPNNARASRVLVSYFCLGKLIASSKIYVALPQPVISSVYRPIVGRAKL